MELLLARRVVAEGDVDMGVDQARRKNRAIGIDYDIAGGEPGCACGANRLDQPAVRLALVIGIASWSI